MAEDNNSTNDDAASADAWAAMLSGGNDGKATADERVLNQDEIDALLGFDSGNAVDEQQSGLAALLGKSRMAYEKLPMLEIVFDRMVRVLSTSLRNFTSENVDVSIDSMISLRFDDYLNSIPLPALLTVFRANEWENFGLVMVDSALIYSMVDVLLGGRRVHKTIRVEGRPYTTIEQDIVKSLMEIVLADMSQSFDPVSPVTFQFERLETNPRFATITRPNNSALLVRLQVDIDERSGMIEILLPHETLEPIRDLLSQIFIGEKFGQDTSWERYLNHEIRSATVGVSALLDEKNVSLGDLVRLQVGSTILLDKEPNDDVQVKCGDVFIGKARLGRVGEKIAISLLEPIKAKAERNT
jgi:flagellar motor switch protein FliM